MDAYGNHQQPAKRARYEEAPPLFPQPPCSPAPNMQQFGTGSLQTPSRPPLQPVLHQQASPYAHSPNVSRHSPHQNFALQLHQAPIPPAPMQLPPYTVDGALQALPTNIGSFIQDLLTSEGHKKLMKEAVHDVHREVGSHIRYGRDGLRMLRDNADDVEKNANAIIAEAQKVVQEVARVKKTADKVDASLNCAASIINVDRAQPQDFTEHHFRKCFLRLGNLREVSQRELRNEFKVPNMYALGQVNEKLYGLFLLLLQENGLGENREIHAFVKEQRNRGVFHNKSFYVDRIYYSASYNTKTMRTLIGMYLNIQGWDDEFNPFTGKRYCPKYGPNNDDDPFFVDPDAMVDHVNN